MYDVFVDSSFQRSVKHIALVFNQLSDISRLRPLMTHTLGFTNAPRVLAYSVYTNQAMGYYYVGYVDRKYIQHYSFSLETACKSQGVVCLGIHLTWSYRQRDVNPPHLAVAVIDEEEKIVGNIPERPKMQSFM